MSIITSQSGSKVQALDFRERVDQRHLDNIWIFGYCFYQTQVSMIVQWFLATLVALHFTPVSESVVVSNSRSFEACELVRLATIGPDVC